MKLIHFRTDEAYLAAQKKANARKRKRAAFCIREVQNIVDHLSLVHCDRLDDEVIRGICHGSRSDLEGKEFLRGFAENERRSEIVCTDLFPGPGIVEWDFRKQRDEWVGLFDFIYSNALDHSDEPNETLKVWYAQLNPTGRLYIQWTMKHIVTKGGDCFGAALHEYIELLNESGDVVDLLYNMGGRGGRRSVIIIVATNRAEITHEENDPDRVLHV